VEEASIGVEVGADEYMLGQPASVSASDERILVANSQVPVVRTYDFAGRFTGNLGGPGQGPGEYRLPQLVGALADGRFFVLDLSDRRFNLYSAAGEPSGTWPATGAHCCVMRFLGGRGDAIWGVLRDSSLGFIRTGIQAYGPQGLEGETRWPKEIPYTPLTYQRDGEEVEGVPFRPGFIWAVTADGDIVAGASDRYAYEVQRADGSELRVEKTWQPVPIPDEHAEYERRRTVALIRRFEQAGWNWDGAEIPGFQPAFSFLVPTISGETWVVRPGESSRMAECVEDPLAATYADVRANPCWRSEWIIDAFDAGGRFLGDVRVPDGLQPFPVYLFVNQRVVIGVAIDEAGVVRIKRYRLVLPGERETR